MAKNQISTSKNNTRSIVEYEKRKKLHLKISNKIINMLKENMLGIVFVAVADLAAVCTVACFAIISQYRADNLVFNSLMAMIVFSLAVFCIIVICSIVAAIRKKNGDSQQGSPPSQITTVP